MGVPRQQEVRIHNPTASTTVNPGDATTFSVVFLPRQEGTIENVLFVHSSLGTFTYSVRGKGTGSAYRIRPLVGGKLPVNGTLISPVQLHNPHPTTLRVTEIYTSGGDLHLELPQIGSQTQHSATLWVSL
ncbi:unnamed protein product [Gongylonema pulchrum]|uniref:TMEM131_like domain-containing protein n=1 Tax=Gongylonema pulchrum TaxID=637853 RepID=A0A183DCE3_9BILA|nr:unnamed protein product [Gongylonema pulchrum]